MRLPAARWLFVRRNQFYLRPKPEDGVASHPASCSDCAMAMRSCVCFRFCSRRKSTQPDADHFRRLKQTIQTRLAPRLAFRAKRLETMQLEGRPPATWRPVRLGRSVARWRYAHGGSILSPAIFPKSKLEPPGRGGLPASPKIVAIYQHNGRSLGDLSMPSH